jgi:LysM domain
MMSLATVTPSTADRMSRRDRRTALRDSAAPHLRLVDDQCRSGAPADHRRLPAVVDRLACGPAAGPIRLTRRGRIVVRVGSAVLALLMVICGVLLLDRTAVAGPQSHPIPVSYRVVLPGETLWQIAGEVAPRADRRSTVARIIELNALPGAAVSAGQRIAVPGSTS